MVKILYSLERIGLNDFENDSDFDINDKKCSGRGRIVKIKWGKQSWKTMENVSINLYCIDVFIVTKKNCKNRQELSHRPNI